MSAPSNADQMLYERGNLIGQLAFADLRKQALVNENQGG
jgi:hypothetical protein